MTIVKTTTPVKAEILPNGCLSVLEMTVITEDGVEIARNNHRHTVSPGDDASNCCSWTQSLVATHHTAECVTAFKAAKAALFETEL